LKKGDKVLDLACGKGRHSIFLNSLGLDVVGLDLSTNSIEYAKKYENDTLKFRKHDMRHSFTSKYDAIFNMFTSFGYFVDDVEDIRVLRNIKDGLKDDNSVAVIDYLNVQKAINDMKEHETIERDGILFNIKKYLKNDFIIKEIEVVTENETKQYFERVKYLDFDKIKTYLDKVGLKVKASFGNYSLEEYDEEKSSRLILILSK
jgi:cyclopropane fatty-acyl-phospholipid synthase-like methyltransferase